jgi:hypothetical protein
VFDLQQVCRYLVVTRQPFLVYAVGVIEHEDAGLRLPRVAYRWARPVTQAKVALPEPISELAAQWLSSWSQLEPNSAIGALVAEGYRVTLGLADDPAVEALQWQGTPQGLACDDGGRRGPRVKASRGHPASASSPAEGRDRPAPPRQPGAVASPGP